MPRTAIRKRLYGVTQTQLEEVYQLREQAKELKAHLRVIEELKAHLRVIEDLVGEREEMIVDLLTHEASVEPGPITPNPREEARRAPKWKEAYIEALGFEAAQKVIEATKPHVRVVLDLIRTHN